MSAAARIPRATKAQQQLDEVLGLLRTAQPHPKLGVVFCKALPRCQAPTMRGLQCRLVGRHTTRVAHVINGRRRVHEHATCWIHHVRLEIVK